METAAANNEAQNREGIASELVWQYVAYLREQGGTAGGALTPEELDRLREALETAARVPASLEVDAVPSTALAARVIDALPISAVAVRARVPAGPPPWRRPVPVWAAICCAVLGMGLTFWLAGDRGGTAASSVRVVRVPGGAPDVDPIGEPEAHVMLPKLVRNELPARQVRSLMWHMLVCPGCFDEFLELNSHVRVSAVGTERLASR